MLEATVHEYPVLSQNVPWVPGLIVRLTGIGYHKSHRNRPRACAYAAGINRRDSGTSTPHGIPGGRQVIPQECDSV